MVQLKENKKFYTEALHRWKVTKPKYLNGVLLIGLGDFYVSFNEDAKIIAKVTATTLNPCTKANWICIFHYAYLVTALHRVVDAGYRIGICDSF